MDLVQFSAELAPRRQLGPSLLPPNGGLRRVCTELALSLRWDASSAQGVFFRQIACAAKALGRQDDAHLGFKTAVFDLHFWLIQLPFILQAPMTKVNRNHEKSNTLGLLTLKIA